MAKFSELNPNNILFRLLLAVSVFLLLGFSTLLPTPASAGDCGSPPDPWGNASGYASWCSCMGGSYNYSTTACTGARGHTSRRNNDTGGLYKNPRGTGWYCYSKARNGAWGWGEHSSKSRAQNIANGFCKQNSRGQRCRITACQRNASASQRQAIKNGIVRNRSIGKRSKKRRAVLGCRVCYRKLVADIRAGRNSGRYRSYVSQSIAGYNNCKRKSDNLCRSGNILVRSLKRGCNQFRGRAYKKCVTKIVRQH